MAENIIKLHVVDFVAGFSLKALVDESEFGICREQLKVVKNGAEAGHVNETTARFVFVLEEGLYQKASVANFSS